MKFNYKLLCMARDSRELTQAGLADLMKIGQGTLSKYETGLLEPSPEVVRDFVNVLSYPKAFFFQSEQAYGFPPFHFRKRKKLTAKSLNRIIAEMNIRRMHVKRLMHSYERDSTGFIPEIDVDEYHGVSRKRPVVEDIAQHVREAWKVPRGPIENMVSLIERHGGVVVPCDFGTDLIDAMSQRIDGMPVLFFVNRTAPADRVRFTLAHELGHMVLHTLALSDDEAMEEEADAFAGAFLVPADEFRAQLRRFDLPHVANLKGFWKVSMQALAMRAHRLELISPHQRKTFFMDMARLGYRKSEPNEPPAELPEAIAKMIRFHQRKLDYTDADVAELLHLIPSEFSRLYDETLSAIPMTSIAPRLRIINFAKG